MARDGNESLLERLNGEPRADAGLSQHESTIVSELAVPAAVRPDNILEMGYGFWRSRALFSAVELGVFTTLASGALDLEALKQRLRTP